MLTRMTSRLEAQDGVMAQGAQSVPWRQEGLPVSPAMQLHALTAMRAEPATQDTQRQAATIRAAGCNLNFFKQCVDFFFWILGHLSPPMVHAQCQLDRISSQ